MDELLGVATPAYRTDEEFTVFADAVGKFLDATASMAKYWISELHGKVVDQCLQLFGGYGYMNECPIAQAYRDARVTRIYAGTTEVMKLLIARTL